MDASTARTLNMRRLVEESGGPAEWTRRYGGTRWSQPQVSQWISTSGPKSIGGRLARDIEAAMGMPHGSLDRADALPSQPAGLDLAKLTAASEFLEDLFRSKGKVFVASQQAELLAAVYDDLSRPASSTIVDLALRYGPLLDGGNDARQGKAGSTRTDDRDGDRQGARAAKAAARRA